MTKRSIRRPPSIAVRLATAGLALIFVAGPVAPQQLAPKPHYLGVELDRSESASSAIPGARINAIDRGSPAEKAGLQVGDVIVKLGTVAIKNPDDLVVALKSTMPGKPAGVVYLRQGQTQKQTQVVLEGRR